MRVRYSEPDSKRFGKRIFRANLDSADAVVDAVRACRAEGVDMLMARCPLESLAAARELERAGFLLMDTLVYYLGNTARFVEPPMVPGVEIRPHRDSDIPQLQAVAEAAFADYDGHYHNDSRLDRASTIAGYVERFVVTSTRDPAISTFVACLEGRPVGFLTLRKGTATEPADIDLNAVDPSAQRRGIYDGLFKAAGLASRLAGDSLLTVSTSLSNLAPQKVWMRNGLELHHSFHTFHGWSDEFRSP